MFYVQSKVVIYWFSFDDTESILNNDAYSNTLILGYQNQILQFIKNLLCIAYSIDCIRIALKDLKHAPFFLVF